MTAPRCGKRMRRYEMAGGPPVLENPACGRPSGHGGACRSEHAVARYYRTDSARTARARRAARIHARLSAAIADALRTGRTARGAA